MESFHATAIYDYEPVNEDELDLREGDEILVTHARDDGWFQGTNLETNFSGLFPGNYVEEIESTGVRPTDEWEEEIYSSEGDDNFNRGSDDRYNQKNDFDDNRLLDRDQNNYDSDVGHNRYKEDSEYRHQTHNRPDSDVELVEYPPRPPSSAAAAPPRPPAHHSSAAVVSEYNSEAKVEAKVQQAKKKSKPRKERPTLRCAYWAQNLGIFASFCSIIMGALNLVWWSGHLQFDNGLFGNREWPIQNKKVTSPYLQQGLYGMPKTGFFPSEDDLRPEIVDLPGAFATLSFEEFKENCQEGPTPPSALGFEGTPSIRRLAGHYDAEEGKKDGSTYLYVGFAIGPYAMLLGVFAMVLECCCTLKRPKDGCAHSSKCSVAGFVYPFVSLPLFLSVPTALPGLMFWIAGFVHAKAHCEKEHGVDELCCGARKKRQKHWTEAFGKKDANAPSCFAELRAGNEVSSVIALSIWVLINVLLATERAIERVILWDCSRFIHQVTDEKFMKRCCAGPDHIWPFYGVATKGTAKSCSGDETDPFSKGFLGATDYQSASPTLRVQYSYYLIGAKTFGQLLNFNCALIMLPVTRGFLRFVNNKLLNSRGKAASLVPMQKNISFHKLVAKSVLVFAALHTTCHFLAVADTPAAYYDNLQLSPWGTGSMIILSMFFIYPAATDVVRRAMFRTFWGNHHWFIVFFGCLLVHGWTFYGWLVLPMLLYMAERGARVCRGYKPFYVRKIKWIPPVMEIQFCPRDKSDFVFKEGQYLFMRCPLLDNNIFAPEWHPFTISSAHGDLQQKDYVSCHIKVSRGGWTEKLKNYFESMNPAKKYPFDLTHRDEKGNVQIGKLTGADGEQLICIDGPHSAPSQHYDSYRRCMVVGAGIGITPCASILRGTLLYKWKRDYYPESLYFYWSVRHSELGSFQWFVALLIKLMTHHELDKRAGNISAKNQVQIHVYVTSYDKKANETRRRKTLVDRGSISMRARTPSMSKDRVDIGFTVDDLWEQLHDPKGPPGEFLERVMPRPGYTPNNRVGKHIFIWNGRPKWDPAFQAVMGQPGLKAGNDVGVCYCGAPIIAKQLQECCKKYSNPEKTNFKLHKENF